MRAAQSQQTVGYAQQPGMPYSNAGYPQVYDPYQSGQMGMAPNMYGYGQPVYDAYGNLVPQTVPLTSTGAHVSKDKVPRQTHMQTARFVSNDSVSFICSTMKTWKHS